MSNLRRKIESLHLNKNAYTDSLEKICKAINLPFYNHSVMDVDDSVTELHYLGIIIFRGKMETMNFENTAGVLLRILEIIDTNLDFHTKEYEDAIFEHIFKHVHFYGSWKLQDNTVVVTYFKFTMTASQEWFVTNFKNQIIEFEDTLEVAKTDKKKFIRDFLNAMCL